LAEPTTLAISIVRTFPMFNFSAHHITGEEVPKQFRDLSNGVRVWLDIPIGSTFFHTGLGQMFMYTGRGWVDAVHEPNQ